MTSTGCLCWCLGIRAVRQGKHAVARENISRKSGYTPIGELTSALLSGWSFAAEKNLPGATGRA
jgi:hypothetical protein